MINAPFALPLMRRSGAHAFALARRRHRVYYVATLPTRVNINRLEMMPVYQSFGPLAIHREAPK